MNKFTHFLCSKYLFKRNNGVNREVQLTVIGNCDWWEVHSLCNDNLLDSQQRRQQLSLMRSLYLRSTLITAARIKLDVSLLSTVSVPRLLAHTALSRLIFTFALRGLLHMTSLLKLARRAHRSSEENTDCTRG